MLARRGAVDLGGRGRGRRLLAHLRRHVMLLRADHVHGAAAGAVVLGCPWVVVARREVGAARDRLERRHEEVVDLRVRGLVESVGGEDLRVGECDAVLARL